jgi:transcriptional regulator with XRE-family HTH domain
MEAFAKNLRAKRESKGYSKSQMASSLGISEDEYNKLENGQTNPSVHSLKQISDILNTTVAYLLTDRPVQELVDIMPTGQFSAESLSEVDKDTYIKILESQLRTLLAEKNRP